MHLASWYPFRSTHIRIKREMYKKSCCEAAWSSSTRSLIRSRSEARRAERMAPTHHHPSPPVLPPFSPLSFQHVSENHDGKPRGPGAAGQSVPETRRAVAASLGTNRPTDLTFLSCSIQNSIQAELAKSDYAPDDGTYMTLSVCCPIAPAHAFAPRSPQTLSWPR